MPTVTALNYPLDVVLKNGGSKPVTEPITGQRVDAGASKTIHLSKLVQKNILERAVFMLNRSSGSKLTLEYAEVPKEKNNIYGWQTEQSKYVFSNDEPPKLQLQIIGDPQISIYAGWNNLINPSSGGARNGLNVIIPSSGQINDILYMQVILAQDFTKPVLPSFEVNVGVKNDAVISLSVLGHGVNGDSIADVLPLLKTEMVTGSILQIIRDADGGIVLVVDGQEVKPINMQGIAIGGVAGMGLQLTARDSLGVNIAPPDIYIEKVTI